MIIQELIKKIQEIRVFDQPRTEPEVREWMEHHGRDWLDNFKQLTGSCSLRRLNGTNGVSLHDWALVLGVSLHGKEKETLVKELTKVMQEREPLWLSDHDSSSTAGESSVEMFGDSTLLYDVWRKEERKKEPHSFSVGNLHDRSLRGRGHMNMNS